MENIGLTIALIIALGFLCQWASWRIGLPAILSLLAVGIIAGPVLHLFDPKALFGNLLYPTVSLAVSIILFEGSLTLKLSEIKQVRNVVRHLITFGAMLTWLVVSFGAYWLFELDLSLSILFGALMIVTGPTVIVPMLRTVRPNANISNILRWEGILIDPIGALLAVMVFEFIILNSSGLPLGRLVWLFVEIIFTGALLGLAAGYLLEQLLNRHWVPEYLHNLATLALVLLTSSASNYIAHESGLLAVTLMGIWLANREKIHIENILNFNENLTVLLISVLFIVLAGQLDLNRLITVAGTAIGCYLLVQFVARPLTVAVSTIGSELSWRERLLIAWIGPRGIVAAAISALFAIKLQAINYPNAELLVSLTFTVIIGTVLVQSLTAGTLGRWLGVSDPEPNGFLIVGANPLARAIALELQKHGAQVLVADSNYSNIRTARMEGLATFYGNCVSKYADQHLDLIGIGKLLALSPQEELNAIASIRYSTEFGRKNIFHIATTTDQKTLEKHLSAKDLRGYTLFDDQATFAKLSSLLTKDYEIRTTKITEEFDYDAYLAKNPKAIKLFYLNRKDEIHVFVAEETVKIEEGYRIVSALPMIDEIVAPAKAEV